MAGPGLLETWDLHVWGILGPCYSTAGLLTFWTGRFFAGGGGGLCAVGYLTASLVSTHSMPTVLKVYPRFYSISYGEGTDTETASE